MYSLGCGKIKLYPFNFNMDYTSNKQKLKLTSYNCKNFTNSEPKFEFISIFSAKCEFIFLQEHWLYESEFGKLSEPNGQVWLQQVQWMNQLKSLDVPMVVVPLFGSPISKTK